MGLLSKFLGKEVGEALEGLAKGSGDAAQKVKEGLAAVAEALGDKAEAAERKAEPAETVIRDTEDAAREFAPAGTYWGPVMPQEENQYNFNGSYIAYFEQIFRTEFPEYDIEYHKEKNWHSESFTFRRGGMKALVVEILPKSSNAKLLRSRCRAEGVPYLRYYHNVEGWWNVRSYVVERTRRALNG